MKPGRRRLPSRAMLVRAAALVVAVLAASAAHPANDARIHLPDGPGVGLVYAHCRTCHDLQYVRDAKGLLPAQWKAVLASMRDNGLRISDEDEARVLDYLATYLGPHPPAEAAASAQPVAADGRQVYADNCAACHGPEGRGQPGSFPPLAGNPDLARDPLFPVQVVLHGLAGRIEIDGKAYDGAMPPFDHLSNGEVAAVVNFLHGSLGKTQPVSSLSAQDVAATRARAMSPQDVHAVRAAMH
ncbi:MAG: c-type cytochrome [Burkholderiales bacterium]|nr:c-type cytochrome [Burkholderiales bacterium]